MAAPTAYNLEFVTLPPLPKPKARDDLNWDSLSIPRKEFINLMFKWQISSIVLPTGASVWGTRTTARSWGHARSYILDIVIFCFSRRVLTCAQFVAPHKPEHACCNSSCGCGLLLATELEDLSNGRLNCCWKSIPLNGHFVDTVTISINMSCTCLFTSSVYNMLPSASTRALKGIRRS